MIFLCMLKIRLNFILWHLDIHIAELFAEENILSPSGILGSLVKDQVTTYVWICLVFLIPPLVYMPIFMLWSLCFCNIISIMLVPFRFFLLLIYLDIHGLFLVSWITWTFFFSIFLKSAIGILIGLDWFG